MGQAHQLSDGEKESLARLMFIVGLILQIIALFFVAFEVIQTNQTAAISNALLGSTLATVSAYILYRQTVISKRQVDVEEKMLDNATKPVIEVVNKEFRSNSAEILLTNYGNGVAIRLNLHCLVEAPNVDWFEGVNSSTPLKRKSEENGILEDTSIRPQEEPDSYSAKQITIGRKNATGEEVHSSFETVMSQLFSEEDVEIMINFSVRGDSKVKKYSAEDEICDTIKINSSTQVPQHDLETIYNYQNE